MSELAKRADALKAREEALRSFEKTAYNAFSRANRVADQAQESSSSAPGQLTDGTQGQGGATVTIPTGREGTDGLAALQSADAGFFAVIESDLQRAEAEARAIAAQRYALELEHETLRCQHTHNRDTRTSLFMIISAGWRRPEERQRWS